jgi:hypothetical protein
MYKSLHNILYSLGYTSITFLKVYSLPMAPKTSTSAWAERDNWVVNTKDVYEYSQKGLAHSPPAVRNAVAIQLAEHLVSDFTTVSSVFTFC